MPAITEPAVESAKCETIPEVLKQEQVLPKSDVAAVKAEATGESNAENQGQKMKEIPEDKSVNVEDADKEKSSSDEDGSVEKEKVDSSLNKNDDEIPEKEIAETPIQTTPEALSVAKSKEEPKTGKAIDSEVESNDRLKETGAVKNGDAVVDSTTNKNPTTEETSINPNGETMTGKKKEDYSISTKPSVTETESTKTEAAPTEHSSNEASQLGTTSIESGTASSETKTESTATPEPMVTSSESAKVSSDPGSVESGTDSSKTLTTSAEPMVTSSEPGPTSTAEPTPEDLVKIEELKQEGLEHFMRKNFFAAADSFGKVLEIQAPLYGELSEKLAETYFLYGTAMLEYGKSESNVLGEEVAKKDAEEEDDEDDQEEEMDVDSKPDQESDETKDGADEKSEVENGEDEAPADVTVAEDGDKTAEVKDEDEESFCVAWEMLELAKATFAKAKNQKRLGDTLMKLGDVGIETGKPEAINEMLQALEVRKSTFPTHHRIIPETHYTIGVAYAFFQIYDEAAEHFTAAKNCLLARIESLANSDNKADLDEIEEMKKIIPDIEERMQDMLESKKDSSKMTEIPAADGESSSKTTLTAADAKPVKNISHLIKRKRTVDDVAVERASKIIRGDDGAIPSSNGSVPKPDETQEDVPVVEKKSEEKPKDVEPLEKVAQCEPVAVEASQAKADESASSVPSESAPVSESDVQMDQS